LSGTILDVAIGMMFVYLLLSLLCSAGQEVLSSMRHWRANNLKDAINTLLHDPNASFFANEFHLHPLIDSLAPNGKDPSYIPASHFSAVVMDILGKNTNEDPFKDIAAAVAALPDGQMKQSLRIMATRCKGEADAFVNELEQWFDHGMDRASGWYKRKCQKAMFAGALLLAVTLNVDSIQLATHLWQNPAKREAIVAMAANYPIPENPTKETVKALVDDNAQAIKDQLESMGLPIGWSRDKKSICENLKASVSPLSIFGWLITACFVSLGAPFWFNMLGKALNLRAAGKKPGKSKPRGSR